MVYKKAMRTTYFPVSFVLSFILGLAFVLLVPSAGFAATETLAETFSLTAGDPLGLALIIAGLLLVVAEIFIVSHGLLALSGTLFFILGSALVIQSANPEIRLIWANFLAGGLFICAGIAVLSLYALRIYRNNKSHKFALAGQRGLVIQWDGSSQRIEIDGSFWNAESLSGKTYTHGEWVTIHAQKNLTLYID